MLSITKDGNGYIARCGLARCELPVIEKTDPETGHTITETISPSGIRGLFRAAVDVRYQQTTRKQEDGSVLTSYIPRHRVYDSIDDLLVKLATDAFPGQLIRISRIRNRSEASSELLALIQKSMNRLYKEPWDWEGETSYEGYANSFQAVVLDSQLPKIRGRFLAEMDADRRVEGAKALIKAELLASPCATGTGSPGKSYYLAARDGYSPTELANPMIAQAPEKRRGVINAVKNAVGIVGEERGPVRVNGVEKLPPMTNAVVVCMPAGLDDSVIISQSLAEKLTAETRRSLWHNIDGVINYRGGLRSTGRNGQLTKRGSEWPIRLVGTETMEGEVMLRPRADEGFIPSPPVNRDADLLNSLRGEFESKYREMIARLGAGSAEESKEWRSWLAHQERWTGRNTERRLYRRFSCGVERVQLGDAVMYREDLGVSYRQPEVGMKIQTDGDLAKGVVSKILPDEKMPLVRLSGKLARAELVCEMGSSAAKHGSLRFAHGQIALYAVARHLGGIDVFGHPTVEEVADAAVACGVYDSDDLTCEVFDSTGAVSYGRFPAGVTRVCRHKQDPSLVSAVRGEKVETPWQDQSSIRSGGCMIGVADSVCMLSAGLKECARELRAEIPAKVMLDLEALRHAVA